MGGGLMQLVAYGAQDVYLTGNPQITFFKGVYRRHTNFAMEAIEQTFNGTVDFGRKFTATISRNGDLIHRMYLETDIQTTADLFSNGAISVENGDADRLERIGHAMIDYIEVEIGGQLIDKHYGEWMDIWAQLTHSDAEYKKLLRLISIRTNDTNDTGTVSNQYKLYVPLQFWFCRNPGLALPLIALQYHEVKLNVQLKTTTQLGLTNTVLQNMHLFVDYIYLDTDERRRFAQVSHEYLIEQVQENGTTSVSAGTNNVNVDLRFNHPVKEIVWTVQDTDLEHTFCYWPVEAVDASVAPDALDAATGGSGTDRNLLDLCVRAQLKLNGQDRFRTRDGSYFRCVQPYQHHTGGQYQWPRYHLGGFYCYSFALKPEEHQPSGALNMSRIDKAILELKLRTDSGFNNQSSLVKVWAVNYNVLRIMSGMGGLAYSN